MNSIGTPRPLEELIEHQRKVIETEFGPVNSHYEGYTLLQIKMDALFHAIKQEMSPSRGALEAHLCRISAMAIHVANCITRNPDEAMIEEILRRPKEMT